MAGSAQSYRTSIKEVDIRYPENSHMGNFRKILVAIDHGIEKVVEYLVCIILGADLLFILIEITTRYFFALSRSYMEELPKYSLPVIAFLMMGILLKRGSHIAVDIFPAILKDKQRAMAGLKAGIHMVTALGAFGLLYASILIARFTYRSGRMTRMEFDIPTWTLYVGLILGVGILIFYAVALMIEEFGRMISKRTGPTEDMEQ